MKPKHVVCVVALASFALAGGHASADEPGIFSLQHRIDAGWFVGVFLPSDKHEFFDPEMSSQSQLSSVGLDIGGRIAYSPVSIVGIEIEGNLIPTWTEETAQRATLLGIRSQLLLQYEIPFGITPFVAGGGGILGVVSRRNVLGKDADLVGHIGIGAKYRLSPTWSARADFRLLAGPRVATEDGTTAHGEIFLGAAYHFGAESTAPKPKLDADADADGDGIPDSRDRCKSEPENMNGFEDDDGCPETIPDSDGDGLNDLVDECPNEPEDFDQFDDENGCPDEDNDSDGVLDVEDYCPNMIGPADNRGCPTTDNDSDGVADHVDNCPDDAGTVENQGCQTKQFVVISHSRLEILDRVYFTKGKVRIKRRSFVLLNQVASVINTHPEIAKIIIESHTDDRGQPKREVVISWDRANAVMAYLLGRGVSADRVEAMGLGSATPLADNDTRSRSRIEFRVVQPEADPANDADEGMKP